MRALLSLLPLAALLALPGASAGSSEAPELTDAAGDCAQPWANEYADIVAAWISDETETSFMVNMAINRWSDALGVGSGFTLQFEHQDVQFGAAAFYGGAALGGWAYSNAYIDLETGQSSNFTPAEGSFAAGSPAIITVEFAKSFFPHNRPDNALRSFEAGSADFKLFLPLFVASPPVGLPELVNGILFDNVAACDVATSDAEYVFHVGGHSMHEMAAMQAAQDVTNTTGTPESSVAVAAQVEPEGGAAAPPWAWVVLAAGVVLGALRRRT